jgi:hypothetical protein
MVKNGEFIVVPAFRSLPPKLLGAIYTVTENEKEGIRRNNIRWIKEVDFISERFY